MRLLSAVPVFADINIGKKVTLNSRMYLKMSWFHQKRIMKIICENNMCNVWFTSHIYIIRSGVCQFTFLYHISIGIHSFLRRFYPNKKREKMIYTWLH